MTPSEPTIDWCHLPPGVPAESLWDTLHDGEILAIRSDRLARTLTFEVDVSHVRDHHGLSPSVRFFLDLSEVDSARVSTWAIWPGGWTEVEGKSREERELRIAEYRAKWREESVSWSAFCDALEGHKLDISDAEVARDGAMVALRLVAQRIGGVEDGQFFVIFARATRLIFRVGDDREVDLEAFVKLGSDYWEAWAAGSKP